MANRNPSRRLAQVVGAQVRAEAAFKGMSLRQLAAAIGINPTTLHRYTSGQRSMPLEVLYRIAVALDVPMKTIIDRAVGRLDDCD